MSHILRATQKDPPCVLASVSRHVQTDLTWEIKCPVSLTLTINYPNHDDRHPGSFLLNRHRDPIIKYLRYTNTPPFKSVCTFNGQWVNLVRTGLIDGRMKLSNHGSCYFTILESKTLFKGNRAELLPSAAYVYSSIKTMFYYRVLILYRPSCIPGTGLPLGDPTQFEIGPVFSILGHIHKIKKGFFFCRLGPSRSILILVKSIRMCKWAKMGKFHLSSIWANFQIQHSLAFQSMIEA